ncbi:hypothetical protein D8L93_02730 [Sodalis-like symbiont of Bactericera trigonica]|nr:hypothetical protein D8L93_02730 [Sodalis-like symbiont of Bactericera trigonica]
MTINLTLINSLGASPPGITEDFAVAALTIVIFAAKSVHKLINRRRMTRQPALGIIGRGAAPVVRR